MTGRKARVDVARIAVLANHDAGVLNRVVWVNQFGADYRCLRVSIGVAHEGLEPAGLGDSVVVEKNKVIALSYGRSIVTALGKATVAVMRDDVDLASESGQRLLR
jgi:hypothetical protein